MILTLGVYVLFNKDDLVSRLPLLAEELELNSTGLIGLHVFRVL